MQHSFQNRDIRNLLLTICYDGRHFHGWQIQQNAFTVQEAFQNALTKIIGGSFDIKGCSRTDTGVHATTAARARSTSTRFGTVRSAIRFWTAMRSTIAIRSTPNSCTKRRRRMWDGMILLPFVRSITVSRAI